MINNLIISVSFWIISLAFYRLLFEQKTFHLLNRVFLLTTLIIGIFLPFLTEIITIPTSEAAATIFIDLNQWATDTSKVITAPQTIPAQGVYIRIIYFIGFIFSFSRFLYPFHKIRNLKQNGICERKNEFLLIQSDKVESPFSFFQWVFIPKNTLIDSLILKHEFAHVKFGHSRDLLIVEIAAMIFWFVPIFSFYRKYLKSVHEYSADEFVLKETERKKYSYFLLGHSNLDTKALLVNNFQSIIKKRILMMFKTKSKTHYSLLYPFVFMAILGFSSLIITACETTYLPQHSTISSSPPSITLNTHQQEQVDKFKKQTIKEWSLSEEGARRAIRDISIMLKYGYSGDINKYRGVRMYISELEGWYTRIEDSYTKEEYGYSAYVSKEKKDGLYIPKLDGWYAKIEDFNATN